MSTIGNVGEEFTLNYEIGVREGVPLVTWSGPG